MSKFVALRLISGLIALSMMSCSQGGFDNQPVKQSGEAPSDLANDVIGVSIEDRSIEQVLCQDGPKVIGLVHKEKFSHLFSLLCDGETTNSAFKDLILDSYQGNDRPKIALLESSTDDMFVTKLSLAYAIKVPLVNPSLFADLEAHSIFADGITTDNSNLLIDVASREPFPGRRSIEKIVLDYNLNNALGAAIHDKRKTEFNTYLLIEDNRDITVSTEHLLDEENEYYHLANGLTIGLRGENGMSYLVFVSELVIKNRIDPKRITGTMLSLNERVAGMLHEYISNQ
ncbi:MAG: hypothetical protein ACOH5I_08605 [Oligoflexus sp.]